MSTASRPYVLIVDDDQVLADTLGRMASDAGFKPVVTYDGLSALRLCQELRPQVLVTDLHLPGLEGERLIAEIRAIPLLSKLPILVVTSDYNRSVRIRLLQNGADDFINKPVDYDEFQIRLVALAEHCEENLTLSVITSQRDIGLRRLRQESQSLERLTIGIVNVLEDTDALNDPHSGNHIRRVSAYAESLARAHGCKPAFIDALRKYAGLHDIGKVGLPDDIKWNQHPYSDEERERMKEHTELGHRLLKKASLPETAQNIALFHHERWDGSGYPIGLTGELIPIEAAIVGLVDVFDALTCDRPWRQPLLFSFEEAREIMEHSSQTNLHPRLLQLFFKDMDPAVRIRREFPDS